MFNVHKDAFLNRYQSPSCVLAESLSLDTVYHQQSSCDTGCFSCAIAEIGLTYWVGESHSYADCGFPQYVAFEPEFSQGIHKLLILGMWEYSINYLCKIHAVLANQDNILFQLLSSGAVENVLDLLQRKFEQASLFFHGLRQELNTQDLGKLLESWEAQFSFKVSIGRLFPLFCHFAL